MSKTQCLQIWNKYELYTNAYLDSDVLIGIDDGYGLLKPEAAEYTDGVCL